MRPDETREFPTASLWTFMFLVAACLAPGCNGSGDGADASLDATLDGNGEDGDPGDVDGDQGDSADAAGDMDLGEGFGVLVPEGTRGCSQNWVRPDDLDEALQGKGRIAFRPGLVRLPPDSETIEADLVESLEFGAMQAVPQGPGRFQREIYGLPEEGLYFYTYAQSFEAGGQTHELGFKVAFEVKGGKPVEPLLVLDESFLDRSMRLELSVTQGTMRHYYVSCGMPEFGCAVFDFTFEGGDTLKLETCRFCPLEDIVICKVDHAAIRRARMTSGAEGRSVDDFFRLCQSMVHHNWGTDILIVLPMHLGNVHAVYLGSVDEQYPSAHSFPEVHYLDADLAVLEVHAVTRFNPAATW